MPKLTLNEIKKQIAALEAKAVRLAEEEAKASVGKVRALMSVLGVTLEHLSSKVARKGASVKQPTAGGNPRKAQRAGKGIVKYRNPQTGATWTGFGRAPAWIAAAADRDAFLVNREGHRTLKMGADLPATKRRVAAKETPAKKAAEKVAIEPKASGKKAIKTLGKRAASKKASSKAAVVATPKTRRSISATATKVAANKAAKKRAAPVKAAAAPAALDGTQAPMR